MKRLGYGLAQLGHLSGFEARTGTIAVAAQHSSGDYSVELNIQNGGLSFTWPQWAFDSPRRRCCRNSAQRPKHSKR